MWTASLLCLSLPGNPSYNDPWHHQLKCGWPVALRVCRTHIEDMQAWCWGLLRLIPCMDQLLSTNSRQPPLTRKGVWISKNSNEFSSTATSSTKEPKCGPRPLTFVIKPFQKSYESHQGYPTNISSKITGPATVKGSILDGDTYKIV